MTGKAVVIDQPEQMAMFKLALHVMYAKNRARGIHLTRRSAAPTISRLRAEYGVVAGSWKKMATELERVKDKWEREGVPEHILAKFK